MKLRIKLLLLLAFLPFLGAKAQLNQANQKFTKADSLRGSLNPFRSCYDVLFYDLEIRKIEIDKKRIIANNTIRFKVMEDFRIMQIDLNQAFSIEKIVYKYLNIRFTRDGNALFVELPTVAKKGSIGEIQIFYYGNPPVAKNAPWDGGFVWTSDKAANPWISTACQGAGASLWWPCKDHQSDEPDSMAIRVTVPKGFMDVSNGQLRKKTTLPDSSIKFDWFVSYPINTYNVSLNVGKYDFFTDTFINTSGKKLPLDYYVMPENIDKAKDQFAQVKPMLTCFEKYFGPYPFYRDGYKLVETPFLGMEHQSAVAYGNGYQNGYRGRDLSGSGEGMRFDYIVIHESAHEWWGNAITTQDIADMWVHEGFGQYSEAVYLECLYGREAATAYLIGLKRSIRNDATIIGPYGVNEEGSGDMYPKGAVMLNTIRTVMQNDSAWFATIKGLQETFHYKTVTTQQIEEYMIEHTGYNIKPIFEQYLRRKDPPVLEVDYKQIGNDLQVSYRWVTDVTFFDMPIRATTSRGKYEWIKPDVLKTQTFLAKNMRREDFKVAPEFLIKMRTAE